MSETRTSAPKLYIPCISRLHCLFRLHPVSAAEACVPAAAAQVIIPVPILGPPDGPPIDRWFVVKLQDDESMVRSPLAGLMGRRGRS